MTARTGLKPKDRKLATTPGKRELTGNQWQNTPKQNEFMKIWLDPKSPTFANAYQSALKVGYNERYASQIASPAIANKWIQDYQRLAKMQLEHIEQKLINMINGEVDSKSPDDTRVKAIELLGKFGGLIDNKGTSTTVNIVQPILNGASVPGQATSTDTPINNQINNTKAPIDVPYVVEDI